MNLRKQILIGAATMLCLAVPATAFAAPSNTKTDQTTDDSWDSQASDSEDATVRIKGNPDITSDAHELHEMDETHPDDDGTKVRGRK